LHRVGAEYLKKVVSKENQKLITYIERIKRKKQNVKERKELLQILKKQKKQGGDVEMEEKASDSEEVDSDGYGTGDEPEFEKNADDSASDDSDDSEDDDEDGNDRLQVDGAMDIPTAHNIPIVSQLIKKEKLNKVEKKLDKYATTKTKVTEFIEKDENHIESHFVENPFIKIREKASRKQLEANKQLHEDDLVDDDEDQDIVLMKEDNKYVVKDLE